ncbi:alkaline phosphatase PhoX [Cyclobacterium xiamenense]|uniref:alkaline phosphatase PhoX n=1 Tax=Cyclobacterium xiamenense TaxID=1297121 RepID=UPI0012B707F0|nr:alkaline phosphatase PhoX [Cyclobacterium xiamenense]
MTPSINDSRRKFIRNSGMATLGFMGLYQFMNPGLSHAKPGLKPAMGYGPLKKDPAGILNLPEGFTYKIISNKGDKMADGLYLPGLADGMGAFQGKNGRTIVVRNHEISPDSLEHSGFGANNELIGTLPAAEFYDFGKGILPSLGGTTTFVYNEHSGELEHQYLSLAGTIRNCAGGITPWGSWLTCEESTLRKGEYDGKLEKDHGYVFEVPAQETIHRAVPKPITAMGRFNHEAVAVDPASGVVYLTEDRGDGIFYRYVPNSPGNLHQGGKLQALAILGEKSRDTRNWEDSEGPVFPMMKGHKVRWIDLENVTSPDDDLRFQGFEKGAAVFARGEGIWWGDKEVYFACTNGGKIGAGQVFRYTPSEFEGRPEEQNAPGELSLFAEPNDREILKNCDNLAVAPWGDVILCEDHKHPFLVGITPEGALYHLAENVGYASELAGGVFSPSGKTYFVNIQGPGITVAITGPWKS